MIVFQGLLCYSSRMNTNEQDTLHKRFFAPLQLALDRAKHTRTCNDYPDRLYLHSGVGRVIDASISGREWIQKFCAVFDKSISVSNFFTALRSQRRLKLLREVDQDIRVQADLRVGESGDPFADSPELQHFRIYSSDGHSHAASAHEEKICEKKRAVTNIFSLNLRTHTFAHLALTEPAKGKKKEHEIKAIKRMGGRDLRFGAPKGTKVIHAYDPAIIDYREWYNWKKGHGVYIVTTEKSDSKLAVLGEKSWEKNDPRNTGVMSDELVGSSNGVSFRRVRYQDPTDGKEHSFLTTEMTLPPGMIAFIYKLRWDIEKVFDEIKNKLGQQKAWGKGEVSKIQQAHFVTVTHNLFMMFEKKLKLEEGITDEKVRKKQIQRLSLDAEKARLAGRVPNMLVAKVTRATQRSLQFLRWLRVELLLKSSWRQAVIRLRPLMLRYLH